MAFDRSNYTQIPNDLIAMMPELTESEFKVLIAISRKTFGWLKETDKISISQIEKMTGLGRSTICGVIKSDKFNRLVEVDKSGRINEYTLKVSSTEYEPDQGEGVQNLNQGSSKSELTDSSKSEHTKDNITKKNNTKYNYGDSEKYNPDKHRINYTSFVDAFNNLYDKNRRVTESKKKNIRSRLRTFTGQEIEQAWENRLKDDWLNGEGSEYMGNWKAAMRNDEKIDNYLNAENNSDDSHLFDNNKMRKINAGH